MNTSPDETPKARFERLKSEVLTLTSKQKSDLVKVLTASAPEPKAITSGHDTRVYSMIEQVLKEKTGTDAPPLAVMAKRMGPTLTRSLKAVSSFVDQAKGLTEVEKVAAYLLLVRLVIDRMQNDKGLPVTFTTVVQQLEQVGLYFDDAYPGYVQSGMLLMVLRRAAAPAHPAGRG